MSEPITKIGLSRYSARVLAAHPALAAELERRMAELKKKGGYPVPESQTPWQEMFRNDVDELSNGMVLKSAVKYQRLDQSKGVPRDNH